ncbi:MAG: MgtC/SapB family protein [Thermoplasmata archaeon]|nr:MAG: MgtC/SapB family protein [Thermoplasmata archaeon]HEC89437.1 MgtC/SapB family protein [Thermoplasmatales archaeon]
MDGFINWTDVEMVIRLLIAVSLGTIIGFEREIEHKPAGLRTHIFVSMGACLFTISSFYLLKDSSIATFDATRIAAGIVTGISFIGAGSIIAAKGNVMGITTAASLWVTAAIGLMVGFGNYLLPIVATIIAFIVLRLGRIKKKFNLN